jgi:hypothetical protein
LSERLDASDATSASGGYTQAVLAGLTPALTIIIAGIYDPAWRLEIEVVAARGTR